MQAKEFPYALWSLDSQSDTSTWDVIGQVTCGPDDGIKLEIPVGCLLDEAPIDGVVMRGIDPLTTPAVYGFCSTGERITMTGVSTPGPSFSCPGTQHETLFGDSLLVSKSAFITPNPAVKCIQLDVGGLWEWMGGRPANITTHLDEEGRWQSTTGTWATDFLDHLPLYEGKGLAVYLAPTLTEKGGHIPVRRFAMDYGCRLTLNMADSPLQLADAMEQLVFPTWRFLIFCMGFRCGIRGIKITTADDTSAEYYLRLADGVDKPSNTQLDQMPLPYRFIREQPSSMLEEWLQLSGDAKRAASVLTGTLGNRSLSMLDPMFTTIAGAFEAISRVDEKKTDIDKAHYQELVGTIKSALASEDDAEWVERKLNNMPPAGYYATRLAEKLGPFAEYVVPDVSRFLGDFRHNRNAYVHQTSHLEESSTLDGQKLYTHTLAVQLLTYGALMMRLGLPADEVLQRFRKSNYRFAAIYDTRKMYAMD